MGNSKSAQTANGSSIELYQKRIAGAPYDGWSPDSPWKNWPSPANMTASYISNERYYYVMRAVWAIQLRPGSGKAITAFSISPYFDTRGSNTRSIIASLFLTDPTAIYTPKQNVQEMPEVVLNSSTTLKGNKSGQVLTFSFENLNITTNTIAYIWFYSSEYFTTIYEQAKAYGVYPDITVNDGEPSITPTTPTARVVNNNYSSSETIKLFVLNKSFDVIGILENFTSFIWTDRYYDVGDFEYSAPVDDYNLTMLQPGNYVDSPDSEHTMIIEKVEIQSDPEKGSVMTVSGRSLESILDRRVVWGNVTFSEEKLETVLETLLNQSFINPTLPSRKIDNFIFRASGDPDIEAITITQNYSGDNLLNIIKDVCQKYKIGFKIILDDANQFIFTLYNGVNRTYEQNDFNYVVFSDSFENLENSNYNHNMQDYKNVILVTGNTDSLTYNNTYGNQTTPDGTKDKAYYAYTSLEEEPTGIDRRETYYNASGVSVKLTGGSLVPEQDYDKTLINQGKEELAKNKDKEIIDGETKHQTTFIYGEHYSMGDIVNVADPFGHMGEVRIAEYIISFDDNGRVEYPTFVLPDEEDIPTE